MPISTQDVGPSDPVRRLLAGAVASVDVAASLVEVAAELAADEIGAVLVDGPHGPVGLLSERDVVAAVAGRADVASVQAGEVMNADLVWAAPDDAVRDVGVLMRDAGVRHIPVRDGDAVLGVVSVRDVLPVLLAAAPAADRR